MANHFFAINRGLDGSKMSDFVLDTSTTAAADFEFRIGDVDGQTVEPKRLDAIVALKALTRLLEEVSLTTFPKI